MDGIWIMLLTLVPWIELRGSIPLGIAAGIDPLFVLVTAIVLNVTIFFPVWLFLNLLHSRISCWRIMRWASERAMRHKSVIDKWGMPGLAMFIAVPLPFTGVWTATLLAWLLRMPVRPSVAAIALGVLCAAAIVFAATIGVLNGLALLR